MNRIAWSKIDFWIGFISLFGLAIFSFYLYYYQWALWIASDYIGHLNILEDFIALDKPIFPPLYYYSVFYLNFVVKYKYDYIASSMLILGLSVLFKYVFYFFYLRVGVTDWRLSYYLVPLGFFWFGPLYLFDYDGVFFYMGKFSTAIWHNCTTTFVWPFVFLLFYTSVKWLNSPQNLILLGVLILGIITGLAKPSFLFAFVPAFPLMTFFRHKDFRLTFQSGMVSIVLLGLIYYIKFQVYSENPLDTILHPQLQKNEVEILPFAVFNLYSENALLDIFASFLFLFVAFFGFRKELLSSLDFNFSFLLSLFGIGAFLLFAESGSRFADANFIWQVPLTLSLLYLVIGKVVLNSLSINNKISVEWRHGIVGVCWLLHVISGVIYVYKYFYTGAFL